MDRIEGLLSELIDLHTTVVSHGSGIEDAEWQQASDTGQQIIDGWHEMAEALEAVLKAVKDDPSLQEQLVIAHFGGDETLPFAKAIRQVVTALARAKGMAE